MDLDPDPMDLMDLRLTGFGSRSNPSISYTGGRVGIGGKAGIGASSGKDAFRPSRVPLLLHKALSTVYSGGVGE